MAVNSTAAAARGLGMADKLAQDAWDRFWGGLINPPCRLGRPCGPSWYAPKKTWYLIVGRSGIDERRPHSPWKTMIEDESEDEEEDEEQEADEE
jgi:hypothetical protein